MFQFSETIVNDFMLPVQVFYQDEKLKSDTARFDFMEAR